MTRYPGPLRPGDRIGVTAPSSGVDADLRPRLDFCVDVVRRRGYDVVLGDCLRADTYVSAPAEQRAAELTDMLTDPNIRAVVPPWGGELAVDLLDLLDWKRIAKAEPTWLVGYSDLTTVMVPLTLRTGWATVHGNNLMDTGYEVPGSLLSWLDVVALEPGATFRQHGFDHHASPGFDDWAGNPTVTRRDLERSGRWVRLDAEGPVRAEGRLVGGCIETLANLTGTPHGDLVGYGRGAREGLILYVEAAEDPAYDIARRLHGMRMAGWFEHAHAVLVGRTHAPDSEGLTQHQAVLDALGGLGVPIIADVECGHVSPHLPIVNGALGSVTFSDLECTLTQTLR